MWFLILFAIFIIIFLIWGVIYDKKEKQKKDYEKDIISKKCIEYNADYSTKIRHICGLPIAENSECTMYLNHNQIIIESMGNVFKLQKNKILDMSIKTSKEVQNSISGAVGGYMLLGPLGAFIGGSSTEFHRFFIIIYKNKDDKEQCISFDMKDNLKTYKQIYNYIESFKNRIVNKNEIEI